MQTFRVVKEPHGWAVRLGPGMCTPFWSEALAIREAHRLCQALRAHGVEAEVVVEIEAEPEGLAASDAPEERRTERWSGQTAWR